MERKEYVIALALWNLACLVITYGYWYSHLASGNISTLGNEDLHSMRLDLDIVCTCSSQLPLT